jgi:hypothetical protein
MNNFEYKNIDDILNAKEPIRGSRYSIQKNRRVIIPRIYTEDNDELSVKKDSFELHVFYNNTAYYGSIYGIKDWSVDNLYDPTIIDLDIIKHTSALSLLPGSYKVVYNFFRDKISSQSSSTKLFIAEISTDRRELVLALTNPNDFTQTENLKSFVLDYLKPKTYFPPIILNFGENKIIDVLNVTSDGSETYFYVKLINPLPNDLGLKFQCWLSTQILKPYIDQIEVIAKKENIVPIENILRGPNYNADYNYHMISETDYKSWSELLSENVVTSQQLLNKNLYGDTKPVKLNIDFSSFSNFCFYSSAVERVENFYYKIQLLEGYRNELDKLSTYIGSYIDIDTNRTKIKNLLNKVIEGFDEWEKWLYYEDFNYDVDITQVDIITPFPKYEVGSTYDIVTKSGKYKFWKTTEGPAERWYNATLNLAKEFDSTNRNALYKVLPEHVKSDIQNEQFISFVNMVGQHFDIIYTYTEHILKKNLRDEDPNSGISQDLIQVATKNFGWNLSSNTQNKNLWEYLFGLDENNQHKYNVLGEKYNKTEEERTKEVWRRILNNLPYIYKTKGTSRGIKALLAAYGIPQTLLTIREFGGAYDPNSYELGKSLYEKSTYYLNLKGSLSGVSQSIYVPWEQVKYNDTWNYPDTVTFRWKMEPEKFYNYDKNKIQTVLQKSSSNGVDWFVAINKNGTDIEKGSIAFYLSNGLNYATASIDDEYLYDDIPLNIMIRRSSSDDLDATANQTYDFILKTQKYGKIVIEKSASIFVSGSSDAGYNDSWTSDGKIYVGYGSNNETSHSLSGSVFELRYWSNPLKEKSFDNHVLAPRAYNGNTSTSSFYDLQAQFKFWQPFDASLTSSIYSSHPNQKNNYFYSSPKVATINNFTSSSFEAITEVYNMDTANIGANTDYFQKVRIDSASLGGALSMHNSYERTNLTRLTPDSNRLMVAFSPQSIINEDIYEAIGDVDLSEYIGNYSSLEDDEYTALNQFAREYWQKYDNRNDFNAYISLISEFDFSVFDQIRQTLPLRSNELLGLVIEPNILERSKTVTVKKINGEMGYSNESNPISNIPNTENSSYDTKNTVLFIGFEDGDVLDVEVIESTSDVETNISTETDEVIKDGDVDVNLKTRGDLIVKNGIIKIGKNKIDTDGNQTNNILKLNYKSYGSLLKTHLSDDSLTIKSTTYNTLLKSTNDIIGNTISINGFGKLDLNFVCSGSDTFISQSYYGQISNYEKDMYYNSILPYKDNIYANTIGYVVSSGSYFKNPNSFENSKRNREFVGCNDYPLPYKKSILPDLNLYNINSKKLNFSYVYENYERPSYPQNDFASLLYNDVSNTVSYAPPSSYARSTIEYNIFPSSSFWKTNIRGGFLEENNLNNVYGMQHSAPRIIKLNTADARIYNKKLFSPNYLQESVITGTNKYLNYPTSQEYIRSFPWVLWWSGSNSSVPNLGPDLGFTSALYISNNNKVSSPSKNPQTQL